MVRLLYCQRIATIAVKVNLVNWGSTKKLQILIFKLFLNNVKNRSKRGLCKIQLMKTVFQIISNIYLNIPNIVQNIYKIVPNIFALKIAL